MASEYTSAGTSFKIFHEGEWHELIIRTRKAHPQVTAEELAQLTQKTIGLWLRVWRSVKQEVWQLAGDAPETVLAERIGTEPMVTVFNKKFDGLSITVNSSDSGQSALDCVMALIFAHDDIADKMPQLFSGAESKAQAPAKPAPAAPAQQAKQPDINNVDAYIPPYAEKAVKRHNDIAQANNTTKGNFFIRSAMEGSIDGLIKLESGAKDKKTWQNGILARKPYDPKAVEYKEKDLIAYPVTGAITVKSWPDGTRYLEIPSVGANIQIKEKPATVYQDKNIPSDWQTLIQHLSLTDKEIPIGLSLQVPASHIVMSISKPATDKDGNPVQFKNYRGLYQLQVESQTA